MSKKTAKNLISVKDIKKNNINILVCGIGGQGVILASTVISHLGIKLELDVKKSEVHGMSQRGGAVTSHIRLGKKVFSPLIPTGDADFLIALNALELERNLHQLKDSGVAILAPDELIDKLENVRSLNICTTGILSAFFDIDEEIWLSAIKEKIKPSLYDKNVTAFKAGREYGSSL
jgi:indolepyruvate ferredoxin oxidoreductase beta subunit